MSITSIPFLAFCLILAVLYFLIPHSFQWMLLLIFSLFFYTRAGYPALVFLVSAAALAYLTALWMEKENVRAKEAISVLKARDQKAAVREDSKKKKRHRFILMCVVLFGVWGVAKYSSMVLETAAQLVDLKKETSYNGAPIVIVAKSADCTEFLNNYPDTANFFIRRPISSDNIALSLTAYLERGSTQIRSSEDKKRILIVDDDRTILKMIKAALEDQYEVTAMLNGSLVEKFLSTNEVDLIILDYEMPFMTGADIFRRLKDDPKNSKIPVCFLTGVSEREKVQEIMALKPRGYLLKPLNIDMLIATINNLT